MAEYPGRLPLFHIDLYRLAAGGAAISDGLLDERQADGVTLIEWADRLGAGAAGGAPRRPDRRDGRRPADRAARADRRAPRPVSRGDPAERHRPARRPSAGDPGPRHGDVAGRHRPRPSRRHADRRDAPGWPATVTARRCCRRSAGCSARTTSADRASGAIVVGTGPGTFTGLRVGLATAKGLAHGLGIPIVGVATSAALLDAAARALGRRVHRRPGAPHAGRTAGSGPRRRRLARSGSPPARSPSWRTGTTLVAVDLAGRAPDDACALGERALGGPRRGAAPPGCRPAGARATRTTWPASCRST